MSDNSAFGFGKFVPGFDFLQNLGQAANPGAKGAPQGMPNMASWVAPTLSVEELDKRIQELKTVQFWLEQNTNALKATIQALEVQKMTLSTLQGMNVNMQDLAKAFTAKMPDLGKVNPATSAESESTAQASTANTDSSEKTSKDAGPAVDPMQWWGSLTQQFQNIAAAAVKDVAAKAMKNKSVKPKAARKTSASKARPSRAKKTARPATQTTAKTSA